MQQINDVFRQALPEALGALIAAFVLSVIGIVYRRYITGLILLLISKIFPAKTNFDNTQSSPNPPKQGSRLLTDTDEEIIRKLEDHNYIIRCAFCAGRGLIPSRVVNWKITYYSEKTCDLCEGKGHLRVKANDLLITDGRCNGTGLEEMNSLTGTSQGYTEKCSTCGGLGIRPLSGELVVIK